jgi:hypothetical protein
MAPEIYKTIDENILDENIGGLATKALNAFYRGDPKYIMPGYNEEKCKGFVSALFKCIDRGQGIAAPSNGLEKRAMADLMREHYVDELSAIFNMGKLAKAGNEEARFDLVKWYSAASYRGFMERGEKRQAESILQKYRTEY